MKAAWLWARWMWLVVLLASVLSTGACSDSESSTTQCTPGRPVICECKPDFRDQGVCGPDGMPVCDICRGGVARRAECAISECERSNGDPLGHWALRDACPISFGTDPNCNVVSEVQGLEVSGVLSIDESGAVRGGVRASALIISDRTLGCSSGSCSSTGNYLYDQDVNASCSVGPNSAPCECSFEADFLRAGTGEASGYWLTFSSHAELYNYCADGDTLTLSSEEGHFRFERVLCAPGDQLCVEDAIGTCNDEGTAFEPTTPCAAGEHCYMAMCMPSCEPAVAYCDRGMAVTCGPEAVRLPGADATECATDEVCVEGQGCAPASIIELGGDPLSSELFVGPLFAGNIIQFDQDLILSGLGNVLSAEGDLVTFEWFVYEADALAGPYARIWTAASDPTLPSRTRWTLAPYISLPLTAGKIYLIAAWAPEGANLGLQASLQTGFEYGAQLGPLFLSAIPGESFSFTPDDPPEVVSVTQQLLFTMP